MWINGSPKYKDYLTLQIQIWCLVVANLALMLHIEDSL